MMLDCRGIFSRLSNGGNYSDSMAREKSIVYSNNEAARGSCARFTRISSHQEPNSQLSLAADRTGLRFSLWLIRAD